MAASALWSALGVAAEIALSGEDRDYQIRHRAYELWNAAGRPDGKHQQFWEEAERELKRLEASGRQQPRSDHSPGQAHPSAALDGSPSDPV